ncbi:uncharacterized protein LOC124699378 [Lolium rigidum]|uniref:uncharacterized protein LOC124699378 n=1 Tax=Lolium rigidum TaxID=89674 RepID=UPI001F5D51B7|nr:uncharacterized protein LOC124699378 [Lolium rigidum]XP_047087651.1 uncharacterized protein LOC124699378 [Lolium rigidum]
MDVVCEECGDAGFRELLLRCSKCKNAARHGYCLDAVIFDLAVEWLCSGCIPKHNEAIKSLEEVSNQRQLSNAQVGCSMISEPTVDNEKLIKARGLCTTRPHQKRNDRVDGSTKHFPSGDASNRGQCTDKPHNETRDGSDATIAQFCSGDALDSCEVFVGDTPNHKNCEKEGEDRNGHLTWAVETSDGSSDPPLDHVLEFELNNSEKAMDGNKLVSNSVDCTDLSSVRSGYSASLKCVEGLEQVGLSVNGEKSEPVKADKGLEKSVVASKFAPNCSKLIQGSDLKTGSAHVLNPLKQSLGSWSMVPMRSSPSNELEDVAVQKNSAERTRCLVDEETNTPSMENLIVLQPSMTNEFLVSDEGDSDKASRISDEVLLSTKGKRMPRRMSGDTEIDSSYKVNGISNLESAKGDLDARNLQRNAGQPSSLDVKKAVLQGAINSELLSSKFVGPCESTKINPRKRKQAEIYTPDGSKYRKTTITNKNEIANDAQSKCGRPALATSLRDGQNMPREDNGGNDKVIGHSKKRKYKKMDTRPLDKPYWTGIMKIDKNYIPLAAHLSTKSCKKVQEQSTSLPPIIKVTKVSTSKTCLKHLEASMTSADSIGLYFFSSDMRPNKELDQLVKHVADSGIVLEAIVGLAKLFIVPSLILPEEYQTFQGKPYLWGVCQEKIKIKRLAPVEQILYNTTFKGDHVQEQHVLGQQNKAQDDTLDQVVHPENQCLLDANQEVGEETLSGNGRLPLVDMGDGVSANISPADHGQPCSNPEAPSLKLCGLVVSRTPRSAQLIQEMQKEGALLFAVQQVMAEPGSLAKGQNMSTAITLSSVMSIT